MRYALLAVLALHLAPIDAAEDPFRIIKLEQDVRNLERQVQTLTRQVDELRMRLGRADLRPGISPPATGARDSETAPGWLDIDSWERITIGMAELEVIEALGAPTTMRMEEGGVHRLMYALEIGAGSFLSGSVTLRDRAVIAVEKPALR